MPWKTASKSGTGHRFSVSSSGSIALRTACAVSGGGDKTLREKEAAAARRREGQQEETISGGKLCSVVEGKQFQLCAGQSVHRFASPSPELSEAWVHALRMEAVFNYQLCPIFPQDRVVVHTLDRRAFECPIKPHTKARDVLGCSRCDGESDGRSAAACTSDSATTTHRAPRALTLMSPVSRACVRSQT